MQSFLLKEKNKKNFLERISNLKYSTQENYKAALHQFSEFCYQAYNARTVNDIVTELNSLDLSERDDAYFDMLQDFVNWLVSKNLSNSTVQMYFQITVYYFSYCGIRVHAVDLRQYVKRPKRIKEKLHVLTKEEILCLFRHTPKFRQGLYLTLIGSGMRIQESVSLRKKDFDPNFGKRIKIDIPAQFTKSQTSHTTFVSKQAERHLRRHLKNLGENDLVFATNHNPFHAKMTEIEAFSRYRMQANLTAKYESTNRHHISLHSFRSYFFTRARRIHDTEVAHAMIGHTTYLDMYDRKDDDEKLELYLQVEPQLRI